MTDLKYLLHTTSSLACALCFPISALSCHLYSDFWVVPSWVYPSRSAPAWSFLRSHSASLALAPSLPPTSVGIKDLVFSTERPSSWTFPSCTRRRPWKSLSLWCLDADSISLPLWFGIVAAPLSGCCKPSKCISLKLPSHPLVRPINSKPHWSLFAVCHTALCLALAVCLLLEISTLRLCRSLGLATVMTRRRPRWISAFSPSSKGR